MTTCYYDDFPIVRVHEGTVRGWRNKVAGARALAVEQDRVALFGGYEKRHDLLTVGALSGDRMRVASEHRVVLPDGKPLPNTVTVIGRGPELHFFLGNEWLRLDATG